MSGNPAHFRRSSSSPLLALLTLALLLSGCSSFNDDSPLPTQVEVSDTTTAAPESPPTAIVTEETIAPTSILPEPATEEVMAPTTEPEDEDAPTAAPTAAPVMLVPVEDPVPNQVVITFSSTATQAERAAYIESIGGTVGQDIARLDTVVVTVPAADALPASPVVAASEPDYYVTAMQEGPPVDDPLYGQQWALPVINAAAGWAELGPDGTPIAVAVIDSGICTDHPDLAGKILPGYDFVDDDTTPQDDFGHGCGVAGIIAATMGNGTGIAGIAPNARIIPLRVLDAGGTGTYSDVALRITAR